MMKQKLLTLVLTCLLWNQNSRAELKIRFVGGPTADSSSVKDSLEKTANDFWFSEEQHWKVVPIEQELEIDFSLVSVDHLAQTRRNRINFNIYTPKSDFDSILRHELAHVFLKKQCPRLSDEFAQELFAYWRSGDYLRILYGQKQIYTKSDAFKELKGSAPFGPSKAIAVTRLINELTKMENEEFLKKWFGNIFHNCRDEAFIQKQKNLTKEFLDQLQGIQNSLVDDDGGFLIFDSLANEVLVMEGSWQKKQPVGSLLKPLAVSFFSDIRKNRKKKNTDEWECGNSGITSWDYKKALNYSCNGFFLDVQPKPTEIRNYVETLNALTHSSFQSQWLNMADIIGLWPSLKLNLLDVAKIYDFVLEKNSQVIPILKNTAIAGTLSGTSQAKWFVDHGIALKSGTTTNLDLSVEKGFIVALFNTATVPKIAILFRSGRRPIDLLAELKSKIEKYVTYQDSHARVQVLSSFKLNSVTVTCSTLFLENGRTQILKGPIDLQRMKSSDGRLSCVGQPFEVRANDQVVRRLYGDLSFQKINSIANLSEARSEKNARARRGSELVLTTSEGHYLKSVFFSESGNYRLELKKAMLLVFKSNLVFWKTKRQPICDTTICQVFNLNYEAVTNAQKKVIDDLILELNEIHLGAKQWLEFSLGGAEAWTKEVSAKEVSTFLKIRELSDLHIDKNADAVDFIIGDKQQIRQECEKIRTFFKFKSCPENVVALNGETFQFSGQGEGHERGMDLTSANQLAIQGFNFDQIIETFYKIEVQKK